MQNPALAEQPFHSLAPIAATIEAAASAAARDVFAMPSDAVAGFTGEYRFLSNFWSCQITMHDLPYPSVEHAYQAAKAADPRDRPRIRFAASPAIAKRMGRLVPMRTDWENAKVPIMYALVRRKFAHPDNAALLLATGSRPIYEVTTPWSDTVWGVVQRAGRFHGANRLGRILEQVRAELRQSPVS